jgi:uncharacterized membrane protein
VIVYDPETGQGAYDTDGDDLPHWLLGVMLTVFLVGPALVAVYLIVWGV